MAAPSWWVLSSQIPLDAMPGGTGLEPHGHLHQEAGLPHQEARACPQQWSKKPKIWKCFSDNNVVHFKCKKCYTKYIYGLFLKKKSMESLNDCDSIACVQSVTKRENIWNSEHLSGRLWPRWCCSGLLRWCCPSRHWQRWQWTCWSWRWRSWGIWRLWTRVIRGTWLLSTIRWCWRWCLWGVTIVVLLASSSFLLRIPSWGWSRREKRGSIPVICWDTCEQVKCSNKSRKFTC